VHREAFHSAHKHDSPALAEKATAAGVTCGQRQGIKKPEQAVASGNVHQSTGNIPNFKVKMFFKDLDKSLSLFFLP
jgi:hypothetical protein